jgi:hypothetical protein
MMRMTYRDAAGIEHTEDLVGPSDWTARQYRQAISYQRPTITITGMSRVGRQVAAIPSSHPDRWWITLRVPGRKLTTVLQHGGWAEARQLALTGAETGALIVRMVPA